MNKIKQGVKIFGISPEMAMCHTIIQSIFNSMGFDCIPTSIIGKVHSKTSLHPDGCAIDYRTKHIPIDSTKELLLRNLKDALPQCDFILEHLGGMEEHIHAEYDPKDDEIFVAWKKTRLENR